jgi:long-chain alkane monooxygenase
VNAFEMNCVGHQAPGMWRHPRDRSWQYKDLAYWMIWPGCRDRERGVFTDPAKVHPLKHEGRYFKVPGVHLCEPSPQRTPLLYQAGSSGRGKQFAGRHAECVFVAAPSKPALKKTVESIRSAVGAAGRDPHSVKIFNMQTAIADATDSKAQAKYSSFANFPPAE